MTWNPREFYERMCIPLVYLLDKSQTWFTWLMWLFQFSVWFTLAVDIWNFYSILYEGENCDFDNSKLLLELLPSYNVFWDNISMRNCTFQIHIYGQHDKQYVYRNYPSVRNMWNMRIIESHNSRTISGLWNSDIFLKKILHVVRSVLSVEWKCVLPLSRINL